MEPFQGITGFGGVVRILGPSQEYYETLLAGFRSTPAPVAGLGILAPLQRAAEAVVRKIEDSMGIDLLNDDEDTTSAENNTSVVMLLEVDGHKLLFTGDAGKTALLNAITYADGLQIPLTGMRFLDVPHHGSKRNINSKILKRMNAGTAYISASKDSDKHPAKKVTNALKKYNMEVYVTRGTSLLHHHNAPDRGWSAATPEPFHPQVEE